MVASPLVDAAARLGKLHGSVSGNPPVGVESGRGDDSVGGDLHRSDSNGTVGGGGGGAGVRDIATSELCHDRNSVGLSGSDYDCSSTGDNGSATGGSQSSIECGLRVGDLPVVDYLVPGRAPPLYMLNLSYNRIGPAGAVALGTAVSTNPLVCHVGLEGNSHRIPRRVYATIDEMTQANSNRMEAAVVEHCIGVVTARVRRQQFLADATSGTPAATAPATGSVKAT